jgi:hypothetical protein
MSENKGMIVLKCCEAANCGVPDAGESAFDYVYQSYIQGVNYVRDGEDYPTRELIENQIPYNNYTVATIWTQLQLYQNEVSASYYGDRDMTFTELFQSMLFEVTSDFIIKGIEDARE